MGWYANWLSELSVKQLPMALKVRVLSSPPQCRPRQEVLSQVLGQQVCPAKGGSIDRLNPPCKVNGLIINRNKEEGCATALVW